MDPLEGKAIVLFDGVCNLCNSSVNFAIDRLSKDSDLLFGAIQSEHGLYIIEGLDLDRPAMESIIYVENGQVWRESSAILKIAALMRFPWPAAAVFRIVPRPIRDMIYRWVGRNRYRWFGKRESCRIPTPELKSRFIDSLALPIAALQDSSQPLPEA